MPRAHVSWRAVYLAAVALAGLLVLLSWAAKARADDISGSYTATAYGPCCDGNVSRDGTHWYPFQWLIHVTVAHATIPRGTRIILYIPPQREGATYAMRTWGTVVSTYEDGAPLTVTDACAIDWGTACPPWQLDLSYVLIVRAGFCAPAENPWRCMFRWGRRQVYMWSISPTPSLPRESFGVVP